jgi:TPR repeat protein
MEGVFRNEPDITALRAAHELLKTNAVEAVRQLQALAERGSVMSMVYLGYAFENGIGTGVSIDEAERWFERAKSRGSVDGAFHLGTSYLNRNAIEKAEQVFSSELLSGYGPALHRLARIYLRRPGRNNFDRGLLLLREASSKGSLNADRKLAVLMMRGRLGLGKVVAGYVLFFTTVANAIRSISEDDPYSDRMK